MIFYVVNKILSRDQMIYGASVRRDLEIVFAILDPCEWRVRRGTENSRNGQAVTPLMIP